MSHYNIIINHTLFLSANQLIRNKEIWVHIKLSNILSEISNNLKALKEEKN